MSDLTALVDGVVARDRRVLARTLRQVDDDAQLGRRIAAALGPHVRGARLIGVTGNPGAGKSTVVDRLIEGYRGRGMRVAVLAVDPSSPFSGGAILGDRIRMVRHFADDGVYIRSLATRGTLGGLSRSTFDSARVLDAAGYDVVLVETVGVGQDEVDVARLADTTVVVLVPGLGDDVQAIKAGLLEIADVFLINKADKEGVPDLERGLRTVLSLAPPVGGWEPPIVKAVASRGQGIDELLREIDRHQEHLGSPAGQARARLRQRELFERLLDAALVLQGRARLGARIDEALAGAGGDPYRAVEELLG